MENLDHLPLPLPLPLPNQEWRVWLLQGFILDFGGDGGLLFHFILSKIVSVKEVWTITPIAQLLGTLQTHMFKLSFGNFYVIVTCNLLIKFWSLIIASWAWRPELVFLT